jgi:hypothetical protein
VAASALVDVWEVSPGSDLAEVVKAVLASAPCFRALVIGTTADSLTLYVADGSASRRARTLFYVANHGVYEMSSESVGAPPDSPLLVRARSFG